MNNKTDYTLAELQAGIDSDTIAFGGRSQLPERFEFPALCRMASIMRRLEPNRAAFAYHFPRGFIVTMTTPHYSSLSIVSK